MIEVFKVYRWNPADYKRHRIRDGRKNNKGDMRITHKECDYRIDDIYLVHISQPGPFCL